MLTIDVYNCKNTNQRFLRFMFSLIVVPLLLYRNANPHTNGGRYPPPPLRFFVDNGKFEARKGTIFFLYKFSPNG